MRERYIMNIFYLDKDTKKCAIYHCDKHVVKMILEYAQILSTTHIVLDGHILSIKERERLWKPTHTNHPSVIWCRQNINNYKWLYDLFLHLLDEYRHRYDKIHKCEKFRLIFNQSPVNIPNNAFFPPPLAMPNEYKLECAIQSYRLYYKKGKSHLALWKKRNPPNWYHIL